MSSGRKIDMVILGLLSHECLTGYDIKKRIDGSIRFFWKGSFGNIYPALAAMEDEGFVQKKGQGERKSRREKISYEIPESGRKVLQEWLEDSKTVNDLKYEMLLKVFFGGVANNAATLATIEEFEKNVLSDLSVLKVYRDNLSKQLEERDHKFFYLTVTFGVETYEGYLRWCKEAKKLLAEQDE